jgi:hypothetical protein
MSKTQLSDVIVPEVFSPYVVRRTAELSAIRKSGIVAEVPGIAVPDGGVTVVMPFWNDLAGESQVLSDGAPLTANKITANKDVACVLARAQAWSANDLAKAFSGSDPMRAMADLVAEYWARDDQKTLLSILAGVFGAASMSGNILDASGETGNGAIITGNMLIDAISLLGDHGGMLTGIVTHSAVMYDLAKKDLLKAVPSVPGTTWAPETMTYLGRNIIADDSCPKDGSGANTIYTTYLFGQGAVGYAEGSPPVPTETERDALAGDDTLVNRRHFILHPRGVKWLGSGVAGSTPGNTELAAAANWTRVYENKNIRVVAIKHKIGGLAASGGSSGGS